MTKMLKIKKKKILFASVLFLFFAAGSWGAPAVVSAYEIVNVKTDLKNDFVLEPAKFEVSLDPGQSVSKDLTITNRMKETRRFKVEVEDFTGSKSGERAVVLMGEERGPYSLKDYIEPELREFSLEPNQKMVMSVKINIPEDAQPGGLYGSVLISSIPTQKETELAEQGAKSGAVIISRLGALFFVRVNGDVVEKGSMKDFRVIPSKKVFFQNAPTGFEILFQNKGSVHLNPYGVIKIKNILGGVVDEIKVDPYFAMPDSLRYRQVKWGKRILLGRYEATALINRGYDDIVDEMSVSFWILPWKLIVSIFTIILLIVLVGGFFFSKFEIKRKS